jgi:formate/nitrite transporter FocA (FNT family)
MTSPALSSRQSPDRPTDRPSLDDGEANSAFRRTIIDGEIRLGRTWPGLLATGTVGGIDVTIGVLALLTVEEATGSRMLGALAFSIGFIALTLGRSELFTENFMVPVVTVVARNASGRSLLRLWGGTLVMNLIGGWLLTGAVVGAVPALRATAVEVARFYPELGLGLRPFLLAILGGTSITLMTWMERNAAGELGRLASAVGIGFLLAAVPLNHVIVMSIEMFAALWSGAPFGYLDWLSSAALAGLGNLLGGLSLVTVLRLVQIGRDEIRKQRAAPSASESDDETDR